MIQAEPSHSSLTSLWPLGVRVSDRALRTRPQQAMLAILLIIGVTVVLCLYLFQTSRITVTNYGITNLQLDYARLQRENSNLLASFAFEQSMAEMKKRATSAGFGPITELDYVTVAPEAETGQPATLASTFQPQSLPSQAAP